MADKRPVFAQVDGDQKQTNAAPGAIEKSSSAGRMGAAIWLLGLILLITVMIAVGGLTRLTDSGLSITEWDPILGAIPPLNAADWEAAFVQYKTSSEFQLQNYEFTMDQFKFIFWWEWGHRQLGRFIGLYWFIGFIALYVTGRMPKPRRMALFWIGSFIGFQGLLGWLMVNSGLQGTRVDVAGYWLMIHLGAAFGLLAYVAWQALILTRSEANLMQTRRAREAKIFGMSTGLMHFAFLQILLGALVAGIDAGRNFNDWPLMAGGFLPPDMFALDPWWRNFFENDGMVQFVHRMSGYLLFAFAIVLCLKAFKSPHSATRSNFALVGLLMVVQMVVGIVTVLNSAPLWLGITHQVIAVLLWLSIVRARFQAGYPAAQSVRG
ncbi:MAG: COX15/CtaA family protein [Planktomarina sp.]